MDLLTIGSLGWNPVCTECLGSPYQQLAKWHKPRVRCQRSDTRSWNYLLDFCLLNFVTLKGTDINIMTWPEGGVMEERPPQLQKDYQQGVPEGKTAAMPHLATRRYTCEPLYIEEQCSR